LNQKVYPLWNLLQPVVQNLSGLPVCDFEKGEDERFFNLAFDCCVNLDRLLAFPSPAWCGFYLRLVVKLRTVSMYTYDRY
jgi:hypothetical protein